jgi:hypothetical protein
MRKIVISLIAGSLLVGAAFAATTLSGGTASAGQDEDTATEPSLWFPRPGRILDEVLADLVADGTISQSQADAITDAIAAKAEEIREGLPARVRHPFRTGLRLGALLDDGVITAEELAELPDGHPLNDPDGPAAAYLEDGEITADELRSLFGELRQGLHNR